MRQPLDRGPKLRRAEVQLRLLLDAPVGRVGAHGGAWPLGGTPVEP